MHAAERHGRIIDFARLVTRGDVSYLAELFVRPDEQFAGVGKRPLDALLPAAGGSLCTAASSDPRALALYVRAGTTPRWPMLWLRTQSAQLGRLPPGDVIVVEAEANDPDLVCWDAEFSGRRRPEDHRHWLTEAALPVRFARAEARIGHGVVQTRGGSALRSPHAVTVGPLGTRTAADAAVAVWAMAEHARRRREVVRLAIPGPHPALPALLAANFRVTDQGTLVSAPHADLFDPARYLPSDDVL